LLSLTAIKFYLRSEIPRRIDIKVKPCIYVITPTEYEICDPVSKKEFSYDEDLLIFDKEFSGTLLISSADIAQGEFRGEIYNYSIPDKAKFILKVYKIKEGIREKVIYRVYVIDEGSKIREVYSERLPRIGISNKSKRLRNIAKQLGLDVKNLLRLPAC